MKFPNPFKRSNKSTTTSAIPEDLQQYYSGQSTGPRRWFGFAVRILALLIIVVLIVWGGVWIVHKFSGRNDDSTKQTATSQQATTQDKGNASTNKQSTSKPSDTSTSGNSNTNGSSTSIPTPAPSTVSPTSGAVPTTPSAAAAPSTDTNTSNTSGTLANTGPGDTIAIALAAAVVGIVARYAWTLRRLSR